MSKSPFGSVKERFESKEKLIAAVQKLATKELWVERVNVTKGLGKVSNAKLLRLHDVLTRAKEAFGSREKLIGSIVELAKRTKDKGYAASLEGYPLPRLLDLHGSLARADKRAKKAPAKAAPKAKKAAAAPKAEKAAVAPKAAAAPKAEKAAAAPKEPKKAAAKKPASK
ncbi:MAG TPA: hypothetical protein VNN72_02750 [Polyangiaceae bacterium]|nr:hypothetical protein [Polyangiaceae bacterium]